MIWKLLRSLLALGAVLFAIEAAAAALLWSRSDGEGHRPIAIDPAVGYGYDRRDYVDSPGTKGSVGTSRLYALDRYGPGPWEPPQALRILALGGSTTDPVVQVKYSGVDGAWPEALGRKLAAAGRSAEIANAGMVGNLAAQELIRLIAVLGARDADVVVSLTGINETYFADRHWYRDPDNRYASKFMLAALDEIPSGGCLFHGDHRLASPSFFHWIRRTSILTLARQLRSGRSSREEGESDVAQLDARALERLRLPTTLSVERQERLEEAADAWSVNVGLMHAVARERGARYLCVLQPAMGVGCDREELWESFRRSLESGEPDLVLHALLAREGALETINHLYGLLRARGAKLDCFKDLSGPDVVPYTGTYFHSPRYPNAAGNARIAERLCDML